VFAKKINTS
jgi:hypothetical protein